jgi:hypothetical protein
MRVTYIVDTKPDGRDRVFSGPCRICGLCHCGWRFLVQSFACSTNESIKLGSVMGMRMSVVVLPTVAPADVRSYVRINEVFSWVVRTSGKVLKPNILWAGLPIGLDAEDLVPLMLKLEDVCESPLFQHHVSVCSTAFNIWIDAYKIRRYHESIFSF